MNDSAPADFQVGSTTAREGWKSLSSTPEAWVTAGAGMALVALFLPWWGYSGGPAEVDAMSWNGFAGWGVAYFVAWIVAAGFLFVRTVGRDAVRTFDMPVADWLVYALSGLAMFISVLVVWASIPNELDGLPIATGVDGISVGVKGGWWLALVAACLVVAGAIVKRAQQPTV